MRPQFHGMSVDEHLSHIRSKDEDDVVLILRLREALESKMAELLQTANNQFDALCAKRGIKSSVHLKKLEQKTKIDDARARLQDLSEVMIASLENFRASGAQDIRRVMKQEAVEPYIEELSGVLDKIAERKRVTSDWVTSVREQITSIRDEWKLPIGQDRILYLGVNELDSGVDDKPQFAQVRDALVAYGNLCEFSRELQKKTRSLEGLSTIYRDSFLDSMKINWIGSATDCKLLFTFLKEAGYVEARHINQFIAKHVLIKGQPTTAEKLGKLQTNRDGKIIRSGEFLKVPPNR